MGSTTSNLKPPAMVDGDFPVDVAFVGNGPSPANQLQFSNDDGTTWSGDLPIPWTQTSGSFTQTRSVPYTPTGVTHNIKYRFRSGPSLATPSSTMQVNGVTTGGPVDYPGWALSTSLAADPHVLCLDGSRIDVYHSGFYRFMELENGVTVNAQVRRDIPERGNTDVFAEAWVKLSDDSTIYIRNGFRDNIVWVRHGDTGEFTKVVGDPCIDLGISDDVFDGATLHFDAKYDNIWIELRGRGRSVACAGLCAGNALSVSSLTDTTPQKLQQLAINKYVAHALLCDSSVPHAVSFHGSHVQTAGQAVNERCLLSSEHWRADVTLDDDGRVVKFSVYGMDRRIDIEWYRTGGSTFADGMHIVGSEHGNDPDQIELELPAGLASNILLRIQSCGAISAASTSFECLDKMKGLFLCNEVVDAKPKIFERIVANEGATFYEQAMEPWLNRAAVTVGTF